MAPHAVLVPLLQLVTTMMTVQLEPPSLSPRQAM